MNVLVKTEDRLGVCAGGHVGGGASFTFDECGFGFVDWHGGLEGVSGGRRRERKAGSARGYRRRR